MSFYFLAFSRSGTSSRPQIVNWGEEKIFSKAWMYSQMAAFEDIGLIFVILIFYLDDSSPINVYVCTTDMNVNDFREGVQRFLHHFNCFHMKCIEIKVDPINNTAFQDWHNSGYVWIDYPYRFGFLRFFVNKKHVQRDSFSLGLVTGDLVFSRPGVSTYALKSMNISELVNGAEIEGFAIFQVNLARENAGF